MPTKHTLVPVGGIMETREYFLSAPPPDWSGAGGNLVQKDNTVTHDFNWPGWRSRIKSRLPCTTPLDGTFYSYHGRTGFLSLTRGFPGIPSSYTVRQRRGTFGTSLTHPSAPTISLVRANNVALVKLVRSILSTQRKMQGLVFIGELREAIRMVRNPFRLLDTGIRNFVRGAPTRFRRPRGQHVNVGEIHRNVSNAWLELSFGMQPLVSDITDGLNAINRLSAKLPPAVEVNGAGTDWQIGPSQHTTGTIGMFLADFGFSNKQSGSVRYHGMVVLNPIRSVETFGITLADVVPAIYELIPYSFLVDYFSNLGDIIQALSLNSASVAWLEKGTKVWSENQLDLSLSPLPPSPGWEHKDVVMDYGRRYVSRMTNVTRVNYTGNTLTPALEFQIPGVGTKWLNIAALGVMHKRASRAVYRL